jgi:5-methylcytosine-specific restriction endonuclease McrA
LGLWSIPALPALSEIAVGVGTLIGGVTLAAGGILGFIGALSPIGVKHAGENFETFQPDDINFDPVSQSTTTMGQDEVFIGPILGSGFSPKTKQKAREDAGGKCVYCGQPTVPGEQSKKGVKPPGNQGETDHYEPKSKGGTNEPGNAKHSCRDCNQGKSNTSPKGTKWELPKDAK